MLLWLIPAAILLVGALAAVAMVVRTVEEAQRLQAELVRVRDLRPSVAELRDEAEWLRHGIARRFGDR